MPPSIAAPTKFHIDVISIHLARAAILGLAVGACSTSEPVKFGVAMGPDGVTGAQLAAEDINAAGGINGRRLELIVVEEGHSTLPQDAIATAERLSGDSHVLAVIGHQGSSVSLAASQVYNARHIAQIAPNSSAPLYTQAGPYSFRLVASDVHQAEFIAAQIAAMSPAPRVAMLYVNDDYGRAFHDLVGPALRLAGTPLVYEAPFLEGEARFVSSRDEILRSITNAKPDLLLWIGQSEELVLLRTQLRQAVPHVRVLGSDAVAEGTTFFGLPAFVGDLMVSYVDISASRPALRSVATRFESASGRGLTDAAALTYDAVGVVAAAMRAGANDREKIRGYFESLGTTGRAYAGITGEIVFDVNGDARSSYLLFVVTPAGVRLARR